MASEILSVPEEHLQDVIIIIRSGCMHTDVDKEVKEQLLKWCKEEQEYLDG